VPVNPLLADIDVPAELLPHRVSVYRETTAGRDTSGGPVEQWVKVYDNLPCLITNGSGFMGGGKGGPAWEQVGENFTHRVYFAADTSGELPRLGVRDRLIFGQWPGGQQRWLTLTWVEDELEAGIVLQANAAERAPG
jgi:hypothetical protein